MACSLTGYKAAPGLTAAVTGDTLAVMWDGAKSQQLRLRFEIAGGTPTIRELAIRRTGGTWTPLASNVTPEFRIVSGMRRMSNQQQPQRRPHFFVVMNIRVIFQRRFQPGNRFIK